MASIRLGEHHGFMVINRRLKATPEHPFMVRRGDEWGFASAEFVQPGDRSVDDQFNEVPVEQVDRAEAPTRTVAIHIPGTNTLLAEGVWVHNDLPAAAAPGSGSASSGSGSGSGPGSSSGSGSSGKSSGASSFSSSGSSSGSDSRSASSSGPGFSASGGTQSGIVSQISQSVSSLKE